MFFGRKEQREHTQDDNKIYILHIVSINKTKTPQCLPAHARSRGGKNVQPCMAQHSAGPNRKSRGLGKPVQQTRAFLILIRST